MNIYIFTSLIGLENISANILNDKFLWQKKVLNMVLNFLKFSFSSEVTQ